MPLTGVTGGGAAANYVRIIDLKPQGTDGGSSTALSWVVRDLNTITNDLAGIASLAANVVTLDAGIYRSRISVPGFASQSHRARLRDIDNNIDLAVGQNADNSNGNTDKSYITDIFTLNAATQMQILWYCTSSILNFGMGRAQNFTGVPEIYTVAEFFQVGVV